MKVEVLLGGIQTNNYTKKSYNILIIFRLIKHTEKLMEEKEEKLCVKVLRTLREMMAIDSEYGEKVNYTFCFC